jgi:hypothetical protein
MQSPGQRFFGHYPNGQFRVLNGEASFFAHGYERTLGCLVSCLLYLMWCGAVWCGVVLSWSTGRADFLLPDEAGRLRSGLNLLGYRFGDNKKVELSVNGKDLPLPLTQADICFSCLVSAGSPFDEAQPSDPAGVSGAASLFSNEEGAAVYVGGVTAACGFLGDIAEVRVSPLHARPVCRK